MPCPSQASKNSNLYHYAPLKEPTHIRILHLMPGHDGDPLQGTIEHVDVKSGVTFSAISYVWGSQETPYRILIGDGQYVPLTKSLHEVLQNLRAVEGVSQKTFWADQICIDQDKADERNHQVAMMGAIYQRASQVITYIGPDTDIDKDGIDMMQNLYDVWQWIKHSSDHLEFPEIASILKDHVPAEESPVWDGFSSILYRTWSTRVWMIQENVVNENTIMVCGRKLFRWPVPSPKIIQAFFDILPPRMKFALLGRRDSGAIISKKGCVLPQSSIGHVLYLRAWVSEHGCNSVPLLDVLRMSRNFACRDPRDKVYALFGLALESDIREIIPDYTKSPRELYIDVALHILRTSQNLDLLNHVGNDKKINLPSWVPDWSPPKSRLFFKHMFELVPGLDCNASANTISTGNFVADHSVLTVRGAIIDCLQCSAGDPSTNVSLLAQEPDLALVEYPRMREVLQKICADLRYQTSLDNIPNELVDHLSRTITAGGPFESDTRYREPSNLFLSYLKVCQFRYNMALFRRDNRVLSRPPEKLDVATEAASSKFSNYFMISEGRSLCVTQNERLCLAPCEARDGDRVAIFYGGKTPYILRPEGDEFIFIGDAYVHGLMQGEALKDPNFESKVQGIRLI